MEFYGTDIHYLEKSGALSPGMLNTMQAAAPLASLAWMRSDAARRQKILMEAEAMNQALRWVEKQRMSAMQAGFSGGRQEGFGKFGSVKLADKRSQSTKDRAAYRGKGMQAGLLAGGALGAAGGAALSNKYLGNPLGGGFAGLGLGMYGGAKAGKAIAKKLQGAPPSAQKKSEGKESTASALSPELHKFAEDIGRRLARGTAGPELAPLMQKAASGAELTEMEKAALIGKMLGGFGKMLGSVGKAIGGTGGLKAGRGGLAQKAGDFLRKKGIGARTSGLVREGIKAAPEVAGKSKSIFSLGTKAKMVGAAGLGLAGYGAYKGLQAGRDYMMKPTAMGRQGSYGVAPSHNVGPYGYNIPQM